MFDPPQIPAILFMSPLCSIHINYLPNTLTFVSFKFGLNISGSSPQIPWGEAFSQVNKVCHSHFLTRFSHFWTLMLEEALKQTQSPILEGEKV